MPNLVFLLKTTKILRERLARILDTEGNKDDDFPIENPPYENKLANLIASPTQVASSTDGVLIFNSKDLEDFETKVKLNFVCVDIELLKLNFESLKRSIDLSTKCGKNRALKGENAARKRNSKK